MPKYTLRRERELGLTESWRQWAEAQEVEEWIQSVAGVLEQGWNDQFVFLYMNFEIPALISFIELRHNDRLDNMNSQLVLTRISVPNGSPWGNNFSFIHLNLLYVPDHHVCVGYKTDLFDAGYEPKFTQEHPCSHH